MSHWIDDVDFQKISRDNPYGFEGFKTIGELYSENSVPVGMGVYMILSPSDEKPGFNSSNGGFEANSKAPKNPDELENNWISGTRVLYIGKAGGMGCKTGLKLRLREYFKWLDGKANGHKGGRDIWQINEPANLLVAWRLTDNEDPRSCEHALLDKFEKDFNGSLPFANHKK